MNVHCSFSENSQKLEKKTRCPSVATLPGSSVVENLPGNTGDTDSILCPEDPLEVNPLDRGAWWATVSVSSVAQSCLTLWPQGLEHARLPCLSPTPGAYYSNSCPLSQWCHPTISSSVVPSTSRLQSCPVSGSLPVSQFFISVLQSTGSQRDRHNWACTRNTKKYWRLSKKKE